MFFSARAPLPLDGFCKQSFRPIVCAIKHEVVIHVKREMKIPIQHFSLEEPSKCISILFLEKKGTAIF